MQLSSSQNSLFETIRRTFIPKLGALVALYNEYTNSSYYVEGETRDNQFVGRVPVGEQEFEKILDSMGFTRNPLASLKSLSTGEIEEGSFRWYPSEESELDSDYQLHCVIYDGSLIPDADTGETYVYAHWEYRWDVYPIRHYRGENFDAAMGVDLMQTMLYENYVEYDYQLPPTHNEYNKRKE